MLRVATGDEGSTLVESLVTVSILGISITAIVGGMYTSVVASDHSRKQADAAAHLASFAEAVKADVYDDDCAAGYTGTTFALPAGYTKDAVVVWYWNAATKGFDASCTTDSGLQRVTLGIRSADGRAAADMQLAKRAP
jgi:type II secretory pathway pseudopilin PulG